jgi:outer membrane protein TolC
MEKIMIKKTIAVFVLVITAGIGMAQLTLSPEEAVKISLENNYGIKLAKNASEIAQNNTSRFNTGELPSVRVNSGANYSISGSEINYNAENIPGSSTWVTNGVDYNAGISANYLIYDFGGRALNKEKLNELLQAAELDERRAIELNILATLAGYYRIAQIRENLYAQESALEISKERKERAQFQFEFGKNNRLAVLNAEVDINRDSIDYLNLVQQLENEKRSLNLLLGRDVETAFSIDTGIIFKTDFFYDQLVSDALNKNIDLLLSQKELQLSELDRKINDKSLKPQISASGSLGLFGGLNDRKPTIRDQFGSELAAGVTLSWNLFDGGYAKIRDENLKIVLDNQQILLEQQKNELVRDLKNTWTSYQNQLYIMQVESANINTASLNFERTREQFSLGQVSSVEFRQAQLNMLIAQVNYNRAKFIAKINELNLLQISGNLSEIF